MALAESDTETPYSMFPGERVRDRLVSALRAELLGPEEPDEILAQSPATRYLVGMLAPANTAVETLEDEELEAADDDAEASEGRRPVSVSLAPSSIGLSFVLPADAPRFDVTVSWGEYQEYRVEAEENISAAGTGDGSSGTGSRPETEWRRTPCGKTVSVESLDSSPGTELVGNEVSVRWMARKLQHSYVVSVFLVNNRKAAPGKRPPDRDWLYQPQIRVHNARILARTVEREIVDQVPESDPDVASAALVYRKRKEFAVGHGASAQWGDVGDVDAVEEIWTDLIPQHEVPIVAPESFHLPGLDMATLAGASNGTQVRDMLLPVLDEYGGWIGGQREHVPEVEPARYRSVAQDHLALMETALARMREGLDLIARDQQVFEAFRFANAAMAQQREVSVRVLRKRRGEEPPTEIPMRWRPFQIGFILLCLRGIVDATSPDREIADLLWFPTGGGKTEAYLGLTAFTLAYRRIRPDVNGLDSSAGTSVLMRYTLRLLTIQQFQRATALMCACERLRARDYERWGETPFTIGLWVGHAVTPNSYENAKAALQQLRAGGTVYEESPSQILFCPWCGADISPDNYRSDDDLQRTLIYCSDQSCPFSGVNNEFGLPVLVVDEEIYRRPPALVLATVDKLARMAWNGRIQSLFGRVEQYCERHGYISAAESHPRTHQETRSWPKASTVPVRRMLAPPDLIIQDELHLISGPLGTLVGIYETVVDGLCSTEVEGRSVGPKVIASTATIRRAREQVRSLFNRPVDVFPPQGLDVTDSFFARQSNDTPGRLYVGVYAPGKSIKTCLVRVYAALLSRAQAEFDADRTSEADSYMTLVAYFNSLRELGGALRLVEDDVPARLRVLRRRGFGPTRILYERNELTSRKRSDEIPKTLKSLERTFFERQHGEYPTDVLLASNMLSVGVDIDRLGLMVVSGQPKTTAEYIQATSRVGRVHPGLVVEVYNWVRPRDTSHYEQFRHYHDTFYRHVEATSVTPFSARARDRALRGVLVSYARLADPGLAEEADANNFRPDSPTVRRIVRQIVQRAYDVTEREDVRRETEQQLKNLVDEWGRAESPPADKPLVYTGWGTRKGEDDKGVLLRPMEEANGRGIWKVAGSLREVESEIEVVIADEEGLD